MTYFSQPTPTQAKIWLFARFCTRSVPDGIEPLPPLRSGRRFASEWSRERNHVTPRRVHILSWIRASFTEPFGIGFQDGRTETK